MGFTIAGCSNLRSRRLNGANPTLIEAIAKGHRWQAQLESGEYPSLEDLAKDVGCDRTYVGRVLRLTSLAPDIIEGFHGLLL